MHRLSLPAIVCLIAHGAFAQFDYRPNREYRSLNTETYEIAVQKNGELDVSLASGEPVFVDAFPMAWVEGDREPKVMTVDGRWSERFPTNDPLGEGNGMALRKDECYWSIRTYPTKPFLAVQVVYENHKKKPVTVRALFPWCVGSPRKGVMNLGADTLDSIRRDATIALPHLDNRGERFGSRNAAIYNPSSRRSLVVGFLTQRAANTTISIESARPEKQPVADLVRFGCYFDPPVTLKPGESLESDVLYLGIVELDPIRGLERFIRAVQAVNRIPSHSELPAHVWLRDGEVVDPVVDAIGMLTKLKERPARPIDLFALGDPESWVWTGDDVTLLMLTNRSDTSTSRDFALDQLAPAGDSLHHAFDVLRSEYLGVVGGQVSVELSAGETRALRLTPRTPIPQVVARAGKPLESVAQSWLVDRLSGRIQLSDTSERLWVAIPDRFEARDASATPGKLNLQPAGYGAIATLTGEAGSVIDWAIEFTADSESR